MNHRPKGPPARRGGPPDTYLPGDPIPVAQATERNGDTAWAEFSELSATQDLRYADTVPLTAPGAATAPLPRPGAARLKLLAGVLARPVTPEAVLLLARQNNRVCPQPAQWQELYELLVARQPAHDKHGPMPVLAGAAWRQTPELAKRMCLRDQIEWAAAHACLDEAHAFLKQLREEDWHHIGS